jgi:hypothetical protein
MWFLEGSKPLIAIALLAFVATPAEARHHRKRARRAHHAPVNVQASSAPSCDETPAAGATSMVVPQFTGYAPSLGGINGSCRGGASRHLGFSACRDTLHKFEEGRSSFIHVAAQQRGGSAALFGCWARTTDAFTRRGIPAPRGKSCHILAVVDHYASSENAGGRGVNGRRTGTKIDVEVSKLDKTYRKLASRVDGNIQCVKRVAGTQNRDKPHPRKIKRRRHRRG